MHIAIRFLAVLTIAALLIPGVRWASLGGPMETCACPPAACMCTGHHHAPGQVPACCQGKGSQCGLQSNDDYLGSLYGTLIYVPTELHWSPPLVLGALGQDTSDITLLPSHVRVPERPPRATS